MSYQSEMSGLVKSKAAMPETIRRLIGILKRYHRWENEYARLRAYALISGDTVASLCQYLGITVQQDKLFLYDAKYVQGGVPIPKPVIDALKERYPEAQEALEDASAESIRVLEETDREPEPTKKKEKKRIYKGNKPVPLVAEEKTEESIPAEAVVHLRRVIIDMYNTLITFENQAKEAGLSNGQIQALLKALHGSTPK